MPRKKKLQEPTASLFDVPEWEARKRDISQYAYINENSELAELWNEYRANEMAVLPSLQTVPRIVAYASPVTSFLSKVLRDAGLSENDVSVIVKDYVNVLWSGAQTIEATLEQMDMALNTIPSAQVHLIDRWGLFCLFEQYLLCKEMLKKYTEAVTGEKATPETRKEFWLSYDWTNGAARIWLFRNYVAKRNLAVVDDGNFDIYTFIRNTRISSTINAYVTLYCICKNAYDCPDEELAQITIPAIITTDTRAELPKIAEKYAESNRKYIQKAGRELAKIRLKTYELRLHENVNKIGAKDMRVLPDPKDLLKTFPLQTYIADFVERNPEYGPQTIYKTQPKMVKGPDGEDVQLLEETTDEKGNITLSPATEIVKDEKTREPVVAYKVPGITEMTIHGIIDATNILPYKRTANGRCLYNHSIDEVTRAAGYPDANIWIKKAFVGGFKMLHDMYFLVESPISYIKRTKSDGTEVNRRVGGLEAVNLLSLVRYGFDTRNIEWEVSPDAARGTPIMLISGTYERMRDKAKGLTQARFNKMLLTRGHKNEGELVDEIFGYEFAKAEAEKKLAPTGNEKQDKENKEAYKNLMRYISGHRADARKKVLKWFEDYQKDKILTFQRTQAKNGGVTYSWHIARPKELEKVEKEKEMAEGQKAITEQTEK